MSRPRPFHSFVFFSEAARLLICRPLALYVFLPDFENNEGTGSGSLCQQLRRPQATRRIPKQTIARR